MSDTLRDTLRDRINDAIIPAMIEHGPDGHTDGSEEIAEAVIAALGLHPRYEARLTSGGSSVHRTLEDAQAAHAKDVERYGFPGGVYVYWQTKAERIE